MNDMMTTVPKKKALSVTSAGPGWHHRRRWMQLPPRQTRRRPSVARVAPEAVAQVLRQQQGAPEISPEDMRILVAEKYVWKLNYSKFKAKNIIEYQCT